MFATGCGGDDEPKGDPPLQPLRQVELPAAINVASLTEVAIDGDAPTDNETAWLVARTGERKLEVHEVGLGDGEERGRPRRLEVPAADAAAATFDVSRWDLGSDEGALFMLSPSRSGVAVTVWSLAERPEPVARGEARLPAPVRGTDRELAVATWSGPRPDLFVIDRGREDERLQVTIFSGESRFREPIVRLKAPLSGVEPDEWGVDVGRVTQPQPDVVLTSRKPGRTNAEVHVLSGEDNFQGFAYRRPLDLSADLPGSYLLRFGVSDAREAVIGIDLRGQPGSITAFPMFEAPEGPL